jgi:PAS domain S-box-containing protein
MIWSLDGVLDNLREAESGQREFLLTGEGALLQSYARASSGVDRALERLRAAAGDDPVRRPYADDVARLARARLDDLDEAIRARREQGAESALALVKAGRGRAFMDKLVARLAEAERDENASRERLGEEQTAAIAETSLTFTLASGLALALLAVIRHLTVRSRRELALRAEWLTTTLRSIGDGVIATDAQGRVTFMNELAEELTGWTQAEAAEANLADVFSIRDEATRQPGPSPVRQVLETGRVQDLANHTMLLSRDGVERSIDDSAAPIRDDRGEMRGVVMVFRDVTRRRRDEAERERLNQELRENDARKDEFLAMLAHELRNPLAAIGGAVAVAKRAGDDRGRVDWAMEVVGRQVKHLSRLIEDLLDVSRITRGKIDLRLGLIEASTLLESAVESVRPLVEQRGHTLEVAIDRGSLWMQADPTRFEQVVVNLLNNAAKYSEDGGRIEFSGSREGDEVVIVVRDRGFGISTEMLPRVFDLFIQGDRSLSRSEGGLGIGLTVVKKLVDLHGGTVAVESEGPGRGSTFVVRMPASAPPSTIEDSAAGPAGSRRPARILVVDDEDDHAQALALLLEGEGHRVRTASRGEEALAIACEQRPEFILLDIGLPGMDGYELASRLRRQEGSRDAVIVAVSGYGQDEDRRRSREAGFDHHLVKPVDHVALSALLSRA